MRSVLSVSALLTVGLLLSPATAQTPTPRDPALDSPHAVAADPAQSSSHAVAADPARSSPHAVAADPAQSSPHATTDAATPLSKPDQSKN